MATATASKAKPTLKIQPLEDRVVILPADELESMRGGLYIPDTAKEKPTQGEVIAVGPGRFEKGERIPVDLKVGDLVIYGKYSGTNYSFEGQEYVIIKASDVLAKLN
jgi:chaperonin GroES